MPNAIAGVDIAKAHLDAAILHGPIARFDNDAKGLARLVRWLETNRADRVVYEPTGPFHQPFEVALDRHGIILIKVNPRNARRFAEASGTLAKTDRIDAATLARMGAALNLEPTPPPEPELRRLRELLAARRAVMDDLVAAKNRLQNVHDALVRRLVTRRMKALEADIAQLDAAIDATIDADQLLSRRVQQLVTIPGIARRTAAVLLVEMPELGTLSGKQAASLAGLAPVARDSGTMRGRRFIRGGRSHVRKALFMAALATARSGAVFHATYQAMRDAGKPPKVAIVALMRKLIVIANAVLRDQTSWRSHAA